MGKLDGKVVLVTGAANGLGKATAKYLASEGAGVACVDLNLGEVTPGMEKYLVPASSGVKIPRLYGQALSDLIPEIRQAGGNAVGLQGDISDEDSCDEFLWNARRLLGPIDVLANVAVLTYFIETEDCPTKWWERCFAVNVQAIFLLSKKVLPHMKKQRSGAIINVSSAAAIGPGRGPYGERPDTKSNLGPPTMYGTTKAAVERLTQGLAEEVYPYGVTVVAVAPANTISTPGGEYLHISSQNNEPAEMMAKAILLLATEPQDKVTGRVCYSQEILQEFGWIEKGTGWGIDIPGTGYSRI
ncbi:SDR family NAD(P)-dependent oxidoreductase [Chloroflexota bacterium]